VFSPICVRKYNTSAYYSEARNVTSVTKNFPCSPSEQLEWYEQQDSTVLSAKCDEAGRAGGSSLTSSYHQS